MPTATASFVSPLGVPVQVPFTVSGDDEVPVRLLEPQRKFGARGFHKTGARARAAETRRRMRQFLKGARSGLVSGVTRVLPTLSNSPRHRTIPAVRSISASAS